MFLFGRKTNSLSRKIKKQLDELAVSGDDFFANGQYEKAIEIWEKALEFIPYPQNVYSETVWFHVSIGDAYFFSNEFKKAYKFFEFAIKNVSGEGAVNPFVLLRLGQCYFELGDEKNAVEYLLRAYMLEGKEMFADSEDKYFDFLKLKVDNIE